MIMTLKEKERHLLGGEGIRYLGERSEERKRREEKKGKKKQKK